MTHDTIGIDISKDHLDAHRLSDSYVVRQNERRAARFANSKAGFAALHKWIGAVPIDRVVYEATGAYHGAFEKAFARTLPLVKVNPLQARRFAQACGKRVKTDAVDAVMLAKMGKALDLAPDQPAAEDMALLKELQVARQALIKDQTRLMNRLQTQAVPLIRRQSKARLRQIKHQLAQLDRGIAERIDDCPQRARARTIVQSIPGIGATTAAAILIEMPEIGTLSNKQTASLAGLAPMTRQSGKWMGKAFIQGGRKFLRDALYMPALVAMRFNNDMKRKYQALKATGKPSKVALTAIMRKLIILANVLVKEQRMWTENQA